MKVLINTFFVSIRILKVSVMQTGSDPCKYTGTGSIGYILYNYCSDLTQMYLASPRCSIELCLYDIIVVIVIFAEQIFGSRRDMP